MKRSQREAAMRGSRHLFRLCLPAVRSTGPLEGSEILNEIPAALALPLFQAYRSVVSWALTPAGERPGLFPPGAADGLRASLGTSDVPEEVRYALEAVCDLLRDPEGADPRRASAACVSLADWADRQGSAPGTAFRLMEAAGMCVPNDSRIAYRAGCIARRQAVWDVAELWFRHSSTVSRRTHDWEAHATAYLGLGNSYLQQGRYSSAQREHRKALRVGARHGLHAIRGAAFHNLLSIAIETSNVAGTERYAREAFAAYGPNHPSIPALAHDIAYFWLVQGQFQRAYPVFQALLNHFHRPEHRLRVLASFGRAAAGVHNARVFERTWNEVWKLTTELEGTGVLTTSLLELAHGAASLGQWERMEDAATQALDLARQRGEADVIANAEQLLSSVPSRGVAVEDTSSPPTEHSFEEDPFAMELASSLQAMAERS